MKHSQKTQLDVSTADFTYKTHEFIINMLNQGRVALGYRSSLKTLQSTDLL